MEKTYYFRGIITRGKKSRRVTIAGIQQGSTIDYGVAECSNKDQFNKKIGRLIAAGRAAKNPDFQSTVTTENPGREFVHACKTWCNMLIEVTEKTELSEN